MVTISYPIGSMYAIYGNIYHQYTPNVSVYTIHGSYGYGKPMDFQGQWLLLGPKGHGFSVSPRIRKVKVWRSTWSTTSWIPFWRPPRRAAMWRTALGSRHIQDNGGPWPPISRVHAWRRANVGEKLEKNWQSWGKNWHRCCFNGTATANTTKNRVLIGVSMAWW